MTIKHPLKLTGSTDAAFKSIPEESTGFVLRGLAVVLHSDDSEGPGSKDGPAYLVDFTVRRQRRVVRSTFSVKLKGRTDSVEQLLLS